MSSYSWRDLLLFDELVLQGGFERTTRMREEKLKTTARENGVELSRLTAYVIELFIRVENRREK